jgi:hypothetical protein
MTTTIPGVALTPRALFALSLANASASTARSPDDSARRGVVGAGSAGRPPSAEEPAPGPWTSAQACALAASRAFDRAIADVAGPLRPLEARGPEVAQALVRTALAERLSPAAVGEKLARAWRLGLAAPVGNTAGRSVARCLRDVAGEAFDGLIRAVPLADAESSARLARALGADQSGQAAWSRRLQRALAWWRTYAEPLDPDAPRDLATPRTVAARIAGTDRIALVQEHLAPGQAGGPFHRRLLLWVPPGPPEQMVLHAVASQGNLQRFALRELTSGARPTPRFPRRTLHAAGSDRG